jgi:hypothetical protein
LATEVVLFGKLGRNEVGFSGELRVDSGEFHNAELLPKCFGNNSACETIHY